ncbi:probable protein phosphatase 2C 11, partial [Tanacetum coccineum]
EVFKQTDVDYLSGENPQQRDAGSTASTAVMFGDRILVANVGDSRAVASRAGSGTWRVGGVLAVSRAFGDKLLKPYVSAEPEIQEVEIDGVEFIIIASDGLWNVVSNKVLREYCAGNNDAEGMFLNLRACDLVGKLASGMCKFDGLLGWSLDIIRQAKRLSLRIRLVGVLSVRNGNGN